MLKFKLLLAIALSLFIITGCRWNDDFRERRQPQMLEPTAKPTFNPNSEYYVGDRLARPEQFYPEPYMPNIDSRYPRPYVPEHPVHPSRYQTKKYYNPNTKYQPQRRYIQPSNMHNGQMSVSNKPKDKDQDPNEYDYDY